MLVRGYTVRVRHVPTKPRINGTLINAQHRTGIFAHVQIEVLSPGFAADGIERAGQHSTLLQAAGRRKGK
jgi:hypothetical protein